MQPEEWGQQSGSHVSAAGPGRNHDVGAWVKAGDLENRIATGSPDPWTVALGPCYLLETL